MLSAGLLCLAATTIIVLVAPGSTIVAIVALTVALALLLPLLIDAILAIFDRVQRRVGVASSEIAVIELRSPKTRLRSIAIAATGAIAVFGSVTIEGSRTSRVASTASYTSSQRSPILGCSPPTPMICW